MVDPRISAPRRGGASLLVLLLLALLVYLQIEGPINHVVNQARFARTRNPCNSHHQTQGNLDVDILQIVCPRADETNGSTSGFRSLSFV